MTTKITCDRCDKDVKRDESYYTRFYNRSTKASANIDLCHICFMEIITNAKTNAKLALDWKVWESKK